MDHTTGSNDRDRDAPFVKAFLTVLLVCLLIFSDKTGQKLGGICAEDVFRQIAVDYEELITRQTVRLFQEHKNSIPPGGIS